MVLVRNFKETESDNILMLGAQIFREKDEMPLLRKAVTQCVPELSFVAVEGNQILGFSLVCQKITYEYLNFMKRIPNCYELAFLGIAPKSQGLGLGTRLLKETLIAIFQTSAQFTCWLAVDTNNVGAISLYERFGFRRWAEITNTAFPCYIMGISHRRYVKKMNIRQSKQICAIS
jgi:ribosomal protein S18 acetylase RimI-like enzyme